MTLALLLDCAQQSDELLPQRSHQRQRRDLDEADDEIERAIEKELRPALALRLIEHPEEDQGHLVHPQERRKVVVEILRDLRGRTFDGGAEGVDAFVAHGLRLLPERRERMQ